MFGCTEQNVKIMVCLLSEKWFFAKNLYVTQNQYWIFLQSLFALGLKLVLFLQ